MKKIINVLLVTLSLCIGFFAYMEIDVEAYLYAKDQQPSISLTQIKKERKDYCGKPAGNGITVVKDMNTWDNVLNNIDYVTLEVKSIKKTDVYALAPWASYFSRKSNGTPRRRRQDVKTSWLDYDINYTPYYIVELRDGSKLIAQFNRSTAKKIADKDITVRPLGQKKGILQSAKQKLAKYNVSTKYIFYAIDNEWQNEHNDALFFIKAGIGCFVFLICSILSLVIANHLLDKKQSLTMNN